LAAALRKVPEAGASTASAKAAQAGAIAAKSDQSAPVARDSRSSKVSLADLDLTTPEGASAARDRLHQAARRLCTQVADSLDLSHQPNFVACVEESLMKAQGQIATPSLVAGAPVAPASPASHP